ncbi:MAG: phosphoglycolate phosphatase [Betaproteobacteria bacterium]|nr:phosphoglycolate phosphatase [Betaproteobacteria bacterium]
MILVGYGGPPLEAALIDLDGTLLDTAGDLAAAINRMLAELGRPSHDVALIAQYIGKGIPVLVHRSLTTTMHGEAELELFARALPLMERFYAEESGRSAVAYPGVLDGLEAMRSAGVRLACVTNKAGRFTGELLAQTGLAQYFDVVVSGDSLARKKPDPLPFTHACERLGIAPDRAVVIGDSVNDFAAGFGAGCKVFAVNYGYNEGRAVADSSPDAIVSSLTEAATLILSTRQQKEDPKMGPIIERLRAIVGVEQVLTEPHDQEAYATDWRRKFFGKPLAVVRPKSVKEVAAVVRLCNDELIAIVPQGGNTSLCGGATTDASRSQIIISLTRMNRVCSIDTANNTMVVEAGCVLAKVQEAAREAGRLFPLSLASEGTCAIGGNLSTNAGGTAVLRYGNTRELTLGLEVVLPDGEIWDGLRGLRKDNTGYDLKHLFIGAEGTLGVVTAIVLKLFPLPAGHATMMVAVDTPARAVEFLGFMQSRCGERLTGIELISQLCIDLVAKHFPETQRPFPETHPQYVLVELSDSQSGDTVRALAESVLEAALGAGLIRDAVVAASEAQSKSLWALRDNVSEAQQKEGPNIKHDVSIPASAIAGFIATTNDALRAAIPDVQLVTFGHIGDGNLHYNVAAPDGVDAHAFMKNEQDRVNLIVHDGAARYRGSISAEHGLGQLKRDEILRYKSPVEMAMMRKIKAALDPLGIMNPGKVL